MLNVFVVKYMARVSVRSGYFVGVILVINKLAKLIL